MKKQIASILLSGFFLLWGVVANAGTTITYLHTDLSGSVIAKSDASGNVIWRKSYAPYGVTTEKDEDNRKGFAGHEEDPDGLVYMGNRYYDPENGRFTSPDTMGVNPSSPMSFNRFMYANDNPYRFVDPDGRSPLELGFLIFDAAQLKSAISSHEGIGMAIGMTAIDVVGVLSPAPGISEVAHGVEAGAKAASSASQAVKLNKAFASEEQMAKIMSGQGEPIAGAGTEKALKQADRLAHEHGGNASDWSKVSGGSRTAPDGTRVETHAFENKNTGQIVQPKTKIRDENK